MFFFIYGWWHLVIFLFLCFFYFPILSLRNMIRENRRIETIKLKQALIEFIIIFIVLEFFVVNYWQEIFPVSN